MLPVKSAPNAALDKRGFALGGRNAAAQRSTMLCQIASLTSGRPGRAAEGIGDSSIAEHDSRSADHFLGLMKGPPAAADQDVTVKRGKDRNSIIVYPKLK